MIKDNLVRKLKSDLASNLVRLDVDGGEKLTRKESNLIKRFRKFVGDGVDLTILRYFLNQANQVLEDAIVLYFEARQDHLKKSDGLEDGKAAPTVERTANPKLEVAPGDKVRVEWAKLDGKKSCTAEVKDVNGRKLVVRYRGGYKGAEQEINLDSTEFVVIAMKQDENEQAKQVVLNSFKREPRKPRDYRQKKLPPSKMSANFKRKKGSKKQQTLGQTKHPTKRSKTKRTPSSSKRKRKKPRPNTAAKENVVPDKTNATIPSPASKEKKSTIPAPATPTATREHIEPTKGVRGVTLSPSTRKRKKTTPKASSVSPPKKHPAIPKAASSPQISNVNTQPTPKVSPRVRPTAPLHSDASSGRNCQQSKPLKACPKASPSVSGAVPSSSVDSAAPLASNSMRSPSTSGCNIEVSDPDILDALYRWNTCSSSKKDSAMRFLLKVLKTVVQNPKSSKYRKLRSKVVFAKFTGVNGMLDLLDLSGFQVHGTHYIMPSSLPILSVAYLLKQINQTVEHLRKQAKKRASAIAVQDESGSGEALSVKDRLFHLLARKSSNDWKLVTLRSIQTEVGLDVCEAEIKPALRQLLDEKAICFTEVEKKSGDDHVSVLWTEMEQESSLAPAIRNKIEENRRKALAKLAEKKRKLMKTPSKAGEAPSRSSTPSYAELVTVLSREAAVLRNSLKDTTIPDRKETSHLEVLTRKWKKAVQEVLDELLVKSKERELCRSMVDLLKKFGLSPEKVGFDIESEEFKLC